MNKNNRRILRTENAPLFVMVGAMLYAPPVWAASPGNSPGFLIGAILCFVLGSLLLLIEAMMPGFGIAGVSGWVLLSFGLTMLSGDWGLSLQSLLIALVLSALLLVLFGVLCRKSKTMKKVVLKTRLTKEEGFVSHRTQEKWLGREGVSVTPLRPTGVVRIDGEPVDVQTQGEFISAGESVAVFKSENGHLFVRRMK
ncbi:MAG: NfeD family protein [Ndongobacter sp.]|nr:NfeD family protein [Ndongobacter sp.]